MLLLLKRHAQTQPGKPVITSSNLKYGGKRGEKARRCKGISGDLKIKQASKMGRILQLLTCQTHTTCAQAQDTSSGRHAKHAQYNSRNGTQLLKDS